MTVVLDFDQFAAQRGSAGAFFSEPGLHSPSAHVSRSAHAAHMRRSEQLSREHALRRQKLREEYDALVAAGEIRPLTRRERLEETAAGHDDNPDVQAARRLLRKRQS